MPVINPQDLAKLQHNPESIRNICILAHVDHGKTSLSDSLIATNGIISPKMAGRVRYLDSRPDEQTRGITMESSAISLFFSLSRKPQKDAPPQKYDHLINLIDSPGHVDFSSEVSTASRLCDGAVVLVDAVEGVCSQTIAVLRQTWIERLKPILVINKMDRLITELKMSAGEANSHLTKLVEQVNAVVGSFFQGERMEDDLRWREKLESKLSSTKHDQTDKDVAELNNDISSQSQNGASVAESADWHEREDEDIYFEPARGDVIFSSAIDGWAFTTKQFAAFYEKKLGIRQQVLEKVLWGDYYLDPKTKKILASKHLKGRSLKPLFVQLVLDNVWAVYDATTGGDKGRGDTSKVEKITNSLSINLPNHVLRSRDQRSILTAILAAWIPLSTAILVSVIEHLPSPKDAQQSRMPGILEASPGSSAISDTVKSATRGLKKDRSSPLVAFVSKMVAIPEKSLPENKTRSGRTLTAEEARDLGRKKRAEIARAQAAVNGEQPELAELKETLKSTAIGGNENTASDDPEEQGQEPERLIGFARLFSGTLEVGDEVYVLSPKFSPDTLASTPAPQKVTVTALYLLMGRELEPLTSVPPGVVFGIGGLEGHVMKSATLCSQLEGSANLSGVTMGGEPIVRVSLEPENPVDLDRMIVGLRLLEQSDPCAKYEVLENGEHVILTAGELHLERCLKDLRERFAGCEIQVGSPIVPYRESIVSAIEMNPPRDKELPRGTVVGSVSSKLVTVRLRVRPLPPEITDFLAQKGFKLQEIFSERDLEENLPGDDHESSSTATDLGSSSIRELKRLRSGLEKTFDHVNKDRDFWKGLSRKIISLGPRKIGANILVDSTKERYCKQIAIDTLLAEKDVDSSPNGHSSHEATSSKDIADKISYAFQLATAQGPLCQEPMQGVAVVLEEINTHAEADAENIKESSGRLTGEIIKTVRESIRQGFLDWSPRLLLAMYSCEIQASTEVLGRVYGVVTRRRGKILAESMNEGTPFFTITATIPVAESFGFSEEIRKRTSGAASPQLIFAGFEMLDEDPFWVPFTEEQLEDLGDTADKENLAKKYMEGVRRRKGLFVQGKKIVESAEKQKTLKK